MKTLRKLFFTAITSLEFFLFNNHFNYLTGGSIANAKSFDTKDRE